MNVNGEIDLVMPVYNEAAELPAVLASLAHQVDQAGERLPRGFFRIIAVDNASMDASREILSRAAGDPSLPELVVLEEPHKGHVLARAAGGKFACASSDRSLIVHADADSLFPPTFIHDIARRFAEGGVDVLSYLGFESCDFWSRVPRLARRQFEEIGTISFSPETLVQLGFDEFRALITSEIFRDFENVPTHCGLAMTKVAYDDAGGYFREFNPDGTERLGVARNILFRLDRNGARLAHIISPSVVTNPRRYLLEAEDLWAGRSYTAGMSDLREPIRDEHYRLLDGLADRLDYRTSRRNALQRFVIDPCIARPERISRNTRYFGLLASEIRDRIQDFLRQNQVTMYTDVRPLSDQLTDEYHVSLLRNLHAMRGLNHEGRAAL